MPIHYFEEQTQKPQLKYRIISKWLKKIIVDRKKETGDLSYIFCNNAFLLNINKKFLKHDYFTDIITFDYVDANVIKGDIFISCEMVVENAKKFGVTLKEEYLRVLAHGLLHLLGYKDGSDEERLVMRREEEECISLYKKIEDGIVNI
jgi:rRNA maturation RNase YbeY